MEKIKVLGFAGSLRTKSHNRFLLNEAKKLKPDNMEIELFDLMEIPLYNGDIEKEGIPESVKLFNEKLSEADSLLIASPEYNNSFTGVLKNAIDWASRGGMKSPLNKKPYALMGVSGGLSGTLMSQMNFRQVGVSVNMRGMNSPGVYIRSGSEKFNSEGEITDEHTKEVVRKFLTAFYEWTKENK